MPDIFSKEKRHDIMTNIRSNDTKCEIIARHWLFSRGLRYRKNVKSIIGKPDIAIKKYKIAIFINGCFWHGHENCKNFKIPKTNVDFWKSKIEKNIDRDQKVIRTLRDLGWQVFVIWECQLESSFESIMSDLLTKINDEKSVHKSESKINPKK